MINKKRKAITPQAATLKGRIASVTKNQTEVTTEFSAPPDYSMINRFFDILTGSKEEPITVQYFDDKDRKNRANSGFRHMNRRPAYPFLLKQQEKNCGIYVMVNAGDGKGRSKKNVLKVRSLFIDLDGSPWESAAKALKPHMRVESSPGRWHLYWLVDDCTLEQFKPLQQAIAIKYNGDKSCCDLSRVLRLPGFFHQKKQPVMTRLSEVNDLPRYSTQQVIDGLGLNLTASSEGTRKPEADLPPAPSSAYVYTDPTTGEMIDLMEWAAANPDFDIVGALNPDCDMGRASEGKHHIACPFASDHTDPSPDSATYVANADEEHPSFVIHCMHAHCVDRDRLEFLKIMLEKGWLNTDAVKLTPLKLRKPPWVNLQIKEILSSQEWSVLSPRERQIAFDLQFLAWRGDDGTFDDNDWILARHLGISGNEWAKYRETLMMSGWLIEQNGRLTNSLTKKEFDKAQIAYSRKCEGAKRGGLATQKRLRDQKASGQFN